MLPLKPVVVIALQATHSFVVYKPSVAVIDRSTTLWEKQPQRLR